MKDEILSIIKERKHIKPSELEDLFSKNKIQSVMDYVNELNDENKVIMNDNFEWEINVDYEEHKNRKVSFLTKDHYPCKLTTKEFAECFMNDLPHFVENMNNLKNMPKKKFIEDWVGTFLAWMEIENE